MGGWVDGRVGQLGARLTVSIGVARTPARAPPPPPHTPHTRRRVSPPHAQPPRRCCWTRTPPPRATPFTWWGVLRCRQTTGEWVLLHGGGVLRCRQTTGEWVIFHGGGVLRCRQTTGEWGRGVGCVGGGEVGSRRFGARLHARASPPPPTHKHPRTRTPPNSQCTRTPPPAHAPPSTPPNTRPPLHPPHTPRARRLVAWGEDTVGGEKYTLRVKDLESGRELLSRPIT